MSGSIATTEPHSPASCSIATVCASMSSEVTTSFPCRVAPVTVSSARSMSVERSAFEPVR